MWRRPTSLTLRVCPDIPVAMLVSFNKLQSCGCIASDDTEGAESPFVGAHDEVTGVDRMGEDAIGLVATMFILSCGLECGMGVIGLRLIVS